MKAAGQGSKTTGLGARQALDAAEVRPLGPNGKADKVWRSVARVASDDPGRDDAAHPRGIFQGTQDRTRRA